MYFDYIRERTPEVQILEKENGFALYSMIVVDGVKMVYIEDIYVKPAYRKTKLATQLSEEIQALAKEDGVRHMLGSVSPSARGSMASIQVLLAHGMVLHSAKNDIIYFYKEIN